MPCLIIPAEFAHHASLIENVGRKAMHPADTFESYARLRKENWTIEGIAAAHGATEPTVQSYLAHVSKERMAAVVTQAVNSEQAQPLLTMKKAQAAAAAEELLTGKGWVPEIMRTQPLQIEMAVEHPMGEMQA